MTTHTASPALVSAPNVPSTDDMCRSAVWTRHWATGAAHSCAGSYGDLYGGAVAAFWREALSSLRPGHRVLDIATGNGALPRLLLDFRPALEVEVDAVDIAVVGPQWISALTPERRRRVRFHPSQAAEALPFPSHRFDMVISQYGLEYSDLACSVSELLRVLAPGGRVALLLHHAESRPVRLAALELAHIDWLQSPQGLLHAAGAMLEPLSRSNTAKGRASLAIDPVAESARQQFNAAQDALRVRANFAGGDGADVLFEIQNAVSHLLGTAVRQGTLAARLQHQTVIAELSDARLRLEELRQHALAPSSLGALSDRLHSAGLHVVTGVTRDGGHLMGWSLTATRIGTGGNP